jgi:hypothetical protein
MPLSKGRSGGEKSAAKQEAAKIIMKSAEKWPVGFVARSRVREFTGGLYSSGFLANCDSLGQGPPGSFRVKRQIAYPTVGFAKWLIDRLGD